MFVLGCSAVLASVFIADLICLDIYLFILVPGKALFQWKLHFPVLVEG